jgi:ADP-ribose pyrophosphatase YjhB (NUDIX family)
VQLTALKVRAYRLLPPRLQRRAVRLATPNFTVGAIGLVTVDGTQVLLVRPSYRSGWVPPGGFVDRGEEPIATLDRELAEELGLHLSFAPWHRVAFHAGRQSVAFISVAVMPVAVAVTPRSPEVLEARWFPVDALPSMAPDFFEGIHPEDLAAVRAAGQAAGAP